MASCLDAALHYVEADYPVFPLRPDKRPYTEHGFKDGTRSADQVRAWWEQWPDAGIGIPVGADSGIIVLDIDPRHGGDESFDRLTSEFGPLPQGPLVRTGGGGRHFWLRHPGGEVPPSAHGFRNGLDLQTKDAYVVAPPSIHPSGKRYEWVGDSFSLGIPLIPAWLIKVVDDWRGGSAGTGGRERKFATGTGGKIPHGQHHDWIVSMGASLVSRERDPDAERLVEDLKELAKIRLDDALSPEHQREIVDSITTAIRKYGARQAPPKLPHSPSPQGEAGSPSRPTPVLPELWGPNPKTGDVEPIRAAFVVRLMSDNHFASFLDTEELLRFKGGLYNGHANQFVYEWVEAQFSNKGKTATERWRKEVVSAIRVQAYVPREDFNPPGWLISANGRIELGDPGSTPTYHDGHDPALRMTYRVPVSYDPSALCTRFLAFLEKALPAEADRVTAQEIFGYCLRSGNPYKMAFFLVGPSDSGKSTFLEVLRGVLGRENTSTIALQALTDNRFSSAGLYGKLANIYPDLSPKLIRDSGLFKMLTGGSDFVPAEKKFQPPFSFRNPAKLVFSANALPPVPWGDDAFFRRWLVLEFNQTIAATEQIPFYETLLLREAPGILNWALEGLGRLEARGRFDTDGSSGETRNKWRRLSDSLAWFAEEMLVRDRNGSVKKTDLSAAYADFCAEREVDARTPQEVGRELPALMPGVYQSVDKPGGRAAKSVKVWKGVRIRSPNTHQPPSRQAPRKTQPEAPGPTGSTGSTGYSGMTHPRAGGSTMPESLVEPVERRNADPDPEDPFDGGRTRTGKLRRSLPPDDPETNSSEHSMTFGDGQVDGMVTVVIDALKRAEEPLVDLAFLKEWMSLLGHDEKLVDAAVGRMAGMGILIREKEGGWRLR